ncbi:disintegrin and metalloproteinase domain-containing protein 10-like, partial [Sinocyclocheilus grahami]|uniref:disintegrin and metalloproteinase domain-containing protein 10-like n=1 Tax=Sinocyclocheilus grahami TaxID=75366 RepID=UPI0007AD5810
RVACGPSLFILTSHVITVTCVLAGYYGNPLSQYIRHYEGLSYDRDLLHSQHQRAKRALSLQERELQLEFHAHGRHFNLRMKRDTRLFSDGFKLEMSGQELDYDTSHIYTGEIYGEQGSLTHGSVVDGKFEGFIQTHRGTFYVEPVERYLQDKNVPFHSVIYHEDHIRDLVLLDSSQINTTSDERDRSNPFRFANIGVEKFLELNSEQNHDDYCLAYVFTDRDFDDGVLGLAWVGAPAERIQTISTLMSHEHLTAIETISPISLLVNRVYRILPTPSDDGGDNDYCGDDGPQHDSGSECTPGESKSQDKKERGNYIMYARATSGDKLNNNKFSVCSVKNISQVLEKKRGSCFVGESQSDGRVSPDLQYGPGGGCADSSVFERMKRYQASALEDPSKARHQLQCLFRESTTGSQVMRRLCFPQETITSTDDPVLLRKRRMTQSWKFTVSMCMTPGCVDLLCVCSPSQGPCCTAECSYKGRNEKCREESECAHQGMCNGASAQCPTSEPKANFTACHGDTQVCLNGGCSGSICEKYGLEVCTCASMDGKDETELCHVCCMERMNPSTCSSTGSERLARFFNKKVTTLQAGSPCNDFKGYCDVFMKCRLVDADGPLARLKKAIFNPELYENIAEWIVAHWWAVLLMGIALIMLMAGFIKICSVHTPSSNPKLPPPKPLPGTLKRRRAQQQQQQQQQHQQQNQNQHQHQHAHQNQRPAPRQAQRQRQPRDNYQMGQMRR